MKRIASKKGPDPNNHCRSISALPDRVRIPFAICLLSILIGNACLSVPSAVGQDNEQALAAYSDAANFQTGGAIELAIQAWKQFVKDYPDHELVPQALHYLGVCHMQRDDPDFAAASEAFAKALQTKDYDLREESMANYGWCLYRSASDSVEGRATPKSARKLKLAIQTFQSLRDQFPKSRFLDRAVFFSGEAAFALGQAQQAIGHYNDLLSMPMVKDSPLRCDALYARGVAYESIGSPGDALGSYKQLIDQCKDSTLLHDVYLRTGDIQIADGNHDQAIQSFDLALKIAPSDKDKAYAIFRQAYAHLQADRPGEAASKYEVLLDQFPNSEYAPTALLASAQSTYRSGKIDLAKKRFARVLAGENLDAATEAAHWIARIEISRSNWDSAAEVVERQLAKGSSGKFAAELHMDQAEILSLKPSSAEQAMQIFEGVYRESGDTRLGSRALYNAAFTALQIGKHQHALKLADEFIERYPDDSLRSEVQSIAAESLLAEQQMNAAAERFQELIDSTQPNHSQRSAWIIRLATALNAAQRFDESASVLAKELDSLSTRQQKAEAFQLLGRAELMRGNAPAAADALQSSIDADPNWSGVSASRLLLGQARSIAGQNESAIEIWTELIRTDPESASADQARYRIGHLESSAGNYDRAIELFNDLLDQPKSQKLIPHALYAKVPRDDARV